ncbi:hypothetical protein, partial [Candidatus Mycobacterium methanotrophicum]
MHAAGAALSALGAAVDATAATSQVNDGVVGADWSGVARITAAASVARLNADDTSYGQLSLLMAQLLQAAGELHTMTPPRMVTHVQANANRGEYLVDNAVNPWVWGALTPRLIELDTEYFGFMWPNNASAGLSYGAGLDAIGAALSGLSALPSLAGGSVAAPAMAAADVGANAGITTASAAMGATEQAAAAAMAPAAGGVLQSAGSGLLGAAPLSAPAPGGGGTAAVSPMADVQPHSPAMPSTGPAQAPPMSMFLPPSAAAINAPAPAPPVQTLSPVTGAPGAGPPGVTSFIKPAEPFKAPPAPSGGQASGLKPGMLNAAALRGPVSAMPLTTTATTSTPATAAQRLAYVSPTPPPSQPAPPSAAQLQTGTITTLQPPPAPAQTPPVQLPTPPAVPQTSLPAPSAGPTGAGTNGTGIQMLGNGPPGAPQAPPRIPPIPLDPSPPVPPPPAPPPEPGQPPLQRRPDVSGWTAPPRAQDAQTALKNLQELEDAIKFHNEHPPNPYDPVAVAGYNSQANYYNHWAAQLEGTVESYNAEYSPASIAQTIQSPNTPYWAHQEPPLSQGPIGQRGSPLNVPKGTNSPATIDGVNFTGHAIDEMQSEGIPLSAVNRALHVGAIEPGKFGRTIFFDATNNISVIQDLDGTIVTVSFGHLHA